MSAPFYLSRYLLILGLLLVFGCDQTDEPGDLQQTVNDCDFNALIDRSEYETVESDSFQLSNLAIENNCLQLTLSASGCSGDDWNLRFIDADTLISVTPPQRQLKIDFSNPELCEAYLTRTYSVDIENLQIQNDSVALTIVNADADIIYHY